MNPADHTPEAAERDRAGEDSPSPKHYGRQRDMRSGCLRAYPIGKRAVASARESDEGIDAIPLRAPMAINHLRQVSPDYVPQTWRLYKESELTHTVKSRYS